jgi:hypothetical protein
MATLIFLELRKLKGSLIWPLVLAAPVLVSVFVYALAMRMHVMPWTDAVAQGVGLWSFFIMPMTIIALSILLSGVEHGPRAWDHILALPVQRWRIYAAKAAVMMLLVGIMSVMLMFEIRLVGMAVAAFEPAKAFTGPFPWLRAVQVSAATWSASLFMGMLQLWIAIRFRSFVAPMAVGLAGTFTAVVGSGLGETIYVPWAMPVAIIAAHGHEGEVAFQIGLWGGVATLLAMLFDLSRREA